MLPKACSSSAVTFLMYYWWWLTFPFISRHTSFHTLPQCLQTIVSVKLCDFWHEFYQLQEGRECCIFSLSQLKSFVYFYFILLSLSKLIGKIYPLHLTFCSLSNTFVDSLFLIFFFWHVLSSCLMKEEKEEEKDCLQSFCWSWWWVSFEFHIPVSWEGCRDHVDFMSWL